MSFDPRTARIIQPVPFLCPSLLLNLSLREGIVVSPRCYICLSAKRRSSLRGETIPCVAPPLISHSATPAQAQALVILSAAKDLAAHSSQSPSATILSSCHLERSERSHKDLIKISQSPLREMLRFAQQ